jgi:hypothetical protein
MRPKTALSRTCSIAAMAALTLTSCTRADPASDEGEEEGGVVHWGYECPKVIRADVTP